MPRPPTSDVQQVIQGAPVVQVESPQKTAEYYRDVLGFEFDYGTDNYAVVWRDNAAIHFVKDERRASGVKIFLWVKNADEVRSELGKTGAKISVEVDDRDYGIRDFGVTDCNGLELVIGHDLHWSPDECAES